MCVAAVLAGSAQPAVSKPVHSGKINVNVEKMNRLTM